MMSKERGPENLGSIVRPPLSLEQNIDVDEWLYLLKDYLAATTIENNYVAVEQTFMGREARLWTQTLTTHCTACTLELHSEPTVSVQQVSIQGEDN